MMFSLFNRKIQHRKHRRTIVLGVAFIIACHSTFAATPESPVVFGAAVEPSTPQAEFGLTVRSTDARTPDNELSGFHLPDGFRAQLFVSEPQIAKPLNMAFDVRGRLWITQTYEYPKPAPAGEVARDSIQVCEDVDGDGSADKVTQFADNLNIPIGLLPYGDGVICFSIPDILYLRDTDGDLVCDQRIRLLGPFDTSKDTHGMVNALRLGQDGWIYACHGFSNHSTVTASDGSKVDLTSGNTFRFRPDGNRIELFTQGQVNPFGMAKDRWGDWYSADCHSKPISRLIRGGCYQSFGRPDNGLGFVPDLMKHLHGSTAISGLVCYAANSFPSEFRGDFFSGNVMTSRINRNRMVATTDAVQAIEQPDFMTSDDPWFRPVDLQLGPDGAIYVADFYNKIIGHYEVPLDHPDRDRFRGRIWRITCDSDKGMLPSELSGATKVNAAIVAKHLVDELGNANATRRNLALQEVVESFGKESEALLHVAVLSSESVDRRVNALWALARMGKLRSSEWKAFLSSADSLAQVHAYRCATEFSELVDRNSLPPFELQLTDDPHANLVLAQTRMEWLSTLPSSVIFNELLTTATSYPPGSLLHQVGKICVRRALEDAQQCKSLLSDWHEVSSDETPSETSDDRLSVRGPHASYLADVLMSLASDQVSTGLLRYLKVGKPHDVQERQVIGFCLTHLPIDQIHSVIEYIGENFDGDLDIQADWIRQVKPRFQFAKQVESRDFQDWTVSVLDAHIDRIQTLLSQLEPPFYSWHEGALETAILHGNRSLDSPLHGTWQTKNLQAEDKRSDALFFSSLTLGEAYLGRWISDPFIAPLELSFWVAGHDGHGDNSAQGLNCVELIDAETGEVLHREKPPRNDIATKITWTQTGLEARAVRVVVTDGNSGNAYAWIAVGRFSVSGLNPSTAEQSIDRLSMFLAHVPVEAWQAKIESLVCSEKLDRSSRSKLAEVYARSKRSFALATVLAAANELHVTDLLPDLRQTVECIRSESSDEQTSVLALEIGKTLGRSVTTKNQMQIARHLIANAQGRSLLVQLIDSGYMGSQSLIGLNALLPETDPNQPAETLALTEDSNTLIKLRTWCQSSDAGTLEQNAMLQKRIAVVSKLKSNFDSGKQLFEKNCQVCHQLAGSGSVIGPQLDGVKTRGLERLAEDILLPHRNVDIAFRTSTLLLDDGTLVAGLVRDSNSTEVRMAKNDGKEVTVSAGEIVSRQDSNRSLMPDNFGDLLSDEQLTDLLAFLAN